MRISGEMRAAGISVCGAHLLGGGEPEAIAGFWRLASKSRQVDAHAIDTMSNNAGPRCA